MVSHLNPELAQDEIRVGLQALRFPSDATLPGDEQNGPSSTVDAKAGSVPEMPAISKEHHV